MVNLRSRERWNAGQVTVDCWVGGFAPSHAELVGRLGFDSVNIDMQHSPIDYSGVVNAILALSGTGTTVTVRVPGHEPSLVQRLLDSGADGVMCPMVNTAEEAKRFVSAVRYPPLGNRSIGAYRTQEGVAEYFHTANSEILAIAQIETAEAMDNLDAIAGTEGLDMLFVGPSDLSVSYGGEPVMDYDDPVTADRHRRIADAAHSAGILAGALAFTEQEMRLAVSWGYDHISTGMEFAFIAAGATQALGMGRQVAAQRSALRQGAA